VRLICPHITSIQSPAVAKAVPDASMVAPRSLTVPVQIESVTLPAASAPFKSSWMPAPMLLDRPAVKVCSVTSPGWIAEKPIGPPSLL
jgi:hypothetical protein